MNYLEKIDKLLEEQMTKKCFKLWKAYEAKIPNIWDRPTSSTGKYHNKANGYVPSIAEHTYEMLYSFVKIMGAFTKPKTSNSDAILLSIVFHDACKYGEGEESLNRKYTDRKHGKIVANKIELNKEIFLKVLKNKDFEILVESVRFHDGRWSVPKKEIDSFTFQNYEPETQLLHTLDMLSSRNLLKVE